MPITQFQEAVATKSFSYTARKFLLSLVAQRNKLTVNNQGRIQKKAALEAIRIIKPYLDAYQYNDSQMAKFFINHFNTISMLLPGEGSSCHEARLKEMMKFYNQALQMKFNKEMEKFSYYRISNEFAEGFIKTDSRSCSVASITFDGKIQFNQYDKSFQKQSGDVLVEITQNQYQDGCRKVIEQIRKICGL